MRKCGCGCGERVEGASRIYRSDECRKRAKKRRYRARAKARATGKPAFVALIEARDRRASLVRNLVEAAVYAGRVEALARREVASLEEAVLREMGAAEAPFVPQAGESP